METLGTRLKRSRLAAGLSLRELARRAEVSPSFVSQIENGKAQPSVASLYTFSQLLNISVDEVFETKEPDEAWGSSANPLPRGDLSDPSIVWKHSEFANRISIAHPSHRSRLEMADGVIWERLAATPEHAVNFMKIIYAPGAMSTDGGDLISHPGYEYGYVIRGVVQVSIGDEVFVLREGESVGFDSTIPHVLKNVGPGEFHGIWLVHGNHD